MDVENQFADFIRRVRAGDGQAAEQLVRQYEPIVRREIRLRLADQRLRRTFDSMDVCQSVLASFFLRASSGSYDVDEPAQLVRLLVKMARNKLASAARAQNRQRRDHRRAVADGAERVDRFADDDPSPSQLVAGRELLQQFRQRLTDDERALVQLRAEGLDWAQVAERLGGTAQARRMQLARAVQRIGRQLGLDDV